MIFRLMAQVSTQPTRMGQLISSICIALIALIICFVLLRWKRK